MSHWLELGVGWHPKIAEWVNDVDTRTLTLPDWGDIDALVPGTNKMIEYKTTIIRLRNWKRLRNHVAAAIHHAAFGGPHAYEVLQHIPGGGPSVERVKEKLIEQARGETLRRIVEGDGEGEALGGRKSALTDQASGETPGACSSDTQTPRDTSEDASR